MGLELVELALAHYRDTVEQECFDRLNESFSALLLSEADCRRAKKKEIILKRSKFEIQLKRFEFNYHRIKTKYGELPEIEEFLKQIQQDIERLKMLKNQNV